MAHSCYSKGKDGKPELRLSVVCHADILGYRRRLTAAVGSGIERELLITLLNAIDESYGFLRKLAGPAGFGDEESYAVKVFSDNIAVGYPVSSRGGGVHELASALDLLSFVQSVMALHGFLMRGGLAIGNHYMDENIVFGDAFLEAVKKDRSATPPRIVLAGDMREIALNYLKRYHAPTMSPKWGNCLLEDTDGSYFINYLDAAFSEFPPDGRVAYTELLEGHKKTVERGLQDNVEYSSVWTKYAWAARYHNFVCREFAERRIYPHVFSESLVYDRKIRTEVGRMLVDPESFGPSPRRIEVKR